MEVETSPVAVPLLCSSTRQQVPWLLHSSLTSFLPNPTWPQYYSFPQGKIFRNSTKPIYLHSLTAPNETVEITARFTDQANVRQAQSTHHGAKHCFAAVLLRRATLPRQAACHRHACKPLLRGRTMYPTRRSQRLRCMLRTVGRACCEGLDDVNMLLESSCLRRYLSQSRPKEAHATRVSSKTTSAHLAQHPRADATNRVLLCLGRGNSSLPHPARARSARTVASSHQRTTMDHIPVLTVVRRILQ